MSSRRLPRQSIFRRVFGAASANSERIVTVKELADALSGRGTASGAVVNDETALRVAAVYACIRILSDSVGMLPWRLYERVSDTDARIATAHPAHEILNVRPNRWQSPIEFKRMVLGHLCLRGNFYGLVSRLGGKAREVVPLQPGAMTVEQGPDLSLTYKYQRRDADGAMRTTVYTQSEILHVRAFSTDGVVGRSPIQVASEAIGLAISTEQHGARLFSNGARPGGVLKHPAQLSKEAQQRLKDQMDSGYNGENALKTLLLEEGMEWQQLGMTAEDSQFIDSRKFQRSDIAMFFGIPPHMLGDVEKSTSWGAGIEQQGIGFVIYTLMPYLVNLSEAVDRDLLSPDDRKRYYAAFDSELLTRPDFKTRQEGRKIMLDSGVISPNEWRKLEGLNPRDGGNEFRSASAGGGAPAAAPQREGIRPEPAESA